MIILLYSNCIITGGNSQAQSSIPTQKPTLPPSPSDSMESGPRQSQGPCWTGSGCTGDTVPADDARDCCVGTNDGQSYGVGPGNCEVEQCIGKSFIGHDTIALSLILF